MAKGIRYTEEFKRDAVAQVVDRGYSAAEVSRRLGVSTKSIYDWVKRYGKAEPKHVATEMALHVLAYNLTRVMNILGIEQLIKPMRMMKI